MFVHKEWKMDDMDTWKNLTREYQDNTQKQGKVGQLIIHILRSRERDTKFNGEENRALLIGIFKTDRIKLTCIGVFIM